MNTIFKYDSFLNSVIKPGFSSTNEQYRFVPPKDKNPMVVRIPPALDDFEGGRQQPLIVEKSGGRTPAQAEELLRTHELISPNQTTVLIVQENGGQNSISRTIRPQNS